MATIANWECAISSSALPLFVEGTACLKWHLERRHSVFLVTGTLAPLARAIARHLPCGVEVCATEVEVLGDHSPGGLQACTGPTKRKRELSVNSPLREESILLRSFAYGNRMSDHRMLEAVGNAVATNPSWRLERAARRRGWKICEWCELREEKRGEKQPVSRRLGLSTNREAHGHVLTAKAAR